MSHGPRRLCGGEGAEAEAPTQVNKMVGMEWGEKTMPGSPEDGRHAKVPAP
jgi:hypothetical protein